jgi:basic membrane protein A and related proteins
MKKVKFLFVFIMILTLVLSACAPQAPEAPAEEPAAEEPAAEEPAAEEPAAEEPAAEEPMEDGGMSIAVILPGSADDQGWNTGAVNALEKMADMGYETTYTERVSIANLEAALRDYAEQGYDIIVGHSFNNGDAIKKIAPDYPDTTFVWSSGYPPLPPNVTAFGAPLEESAYLAGMIGGLMTESNKIGYIGGAETPTMINALGGYWAGAAYVNPDIEVIYTFPGVWDDVQKGKESANAQFAAGVDFMMGRGDGLAEGVLEAAKEAGVWCVGDMNDQNELAPDLMVTSTYWDLSVVLKTIADAVEDGSLGPMYVMGMQAGATDVAPFHGLVPDDVSAQVNAVRDLIIAGEFTVPKFTEVPTAEAVAAAETPMLEMGGEEMTSDLAGMKIAVILPGSADDQGWNTGAVNALGELGTMGVETTYTERVSIANLEAALRDYAEQGYDVVIGHSFNNGDAIKKVAPDYPDTAFVWASGYPPLDVNVSAYGAPLEESAYLAGMIGGLMTESNKIGYIGGAETPTMVNALGGYWAGALYANPDIEVIYTFPGVWDDVQKGKESANAQFAAGVDFMMGRGDGLAEGVLEAAKEEGVWCVGDMNDQNELAPDLMVTSTYWDLSVVYEAILTDVKAGTLGGGMYVMGMQAGATDVAPFHGLVPDDVAAQVDAVRDLIIAGDFTVPKFSEIPTDETLADVETPDM